MANDSLEATVAWSITLLGRLEHQLSQWRRFEEAQTVVDITESLYQATEQFEAEIQRRDQTIASLRRQLALEQQARVADANRFHIEFEDQHRHHLFDFEDCNAHIKRLDTKIQCRDEALRDLAQENEQSIQLLRDEHTLALTTASKTSFRTGFQKGAETSKREYWLRELQLSHCQQNFSAEIRHALTHGEKELLFQRPYLPPLTLHIASLFNEVEILRHLLTVRHMNPNSQCSMLSALGNRLDGVTPMHLAVGAQNKETIRLLHSFGGSLARPSRSGHNATSAAPPMWLVSPRWLKLTEKEDVVGVLGVLKELGWDSSSVLNRRKKTMRELVVSKLGEKRELQREILRALDRW